MSEFKIGDRVRVKKGTKDPDIDGYIIGGLYGVIEDICEENGIKLDVEYPEWVKKKLDESFEIDALVYLKDEDIELTLLIPQPKPKQQGQIVYDALDEWLEKNNHSTKLAQLCYERYKQGIEKYGQPLMTDDGRDTIADVTQELLDAQFYLMKGIMQGKDWNMILRQLCIITESFLENI